MAVISNAFGSVILTEEDAAKFDRQVTYGRVRKEAKESVARGVEMAKEFRASGRELTFTIPKNA